MWTGWSTFSLHKHATAAILRARCPQPNLILPTVKKKLTLINKSLKQTDYRERMSTTPLLDCCVDSIINSLIKAQSAIWTNAGSDTLTLSALPDVWEGSCLCVCRGKVGITQCLYRAGLESFAVSCSCCGGKEEGMSVAAHLKGSVLSLNAVGSQGLRVPKAADGILFIFINVYYCR